MKVTKNRKITKSNTKSKQRNRMPWRNRLASLRPGWWSKGPPQKGNYQYYVFSSTEKVRYVVTGCGLILLLSNTFYDSLAAGMVLSPLLYFYLEQKAGQLQKQRKKEMEKAFRDFILSVAANLQAGFSVENSFQESYKDIVILYGEESDMAYEIQYLIQQLSTNQTVEQILMDLAKRTRLEEIREFSQVFQIAKRTGGDLRLVIANTANVIQDKMMVRQELETVLAEKKLEQTIMKGMPFFIIGYLSITSKDFFEPLYHNLAGNLIMTGCFIGYLVACGLMNKIMEIEI